MGHKWPAGSSSPISAFPANYGRTFSVPVTNDNIDRVVAALRKAMKDLPDPSVTLVGKRWKNPFHVLISCILSLRTKDETTLPASERLFALADSPEAMLKLSAADIEKAIYPVGFYKTKAGRILGICRDMIEKFGGRARDMGPSP